MNMTGLAGGLRPGTGHLEIIEMAAQRLDSRGSQNNHRLKISFFFR
jgi:hypothetical protein